jgi:GntR family transcriptional regulator
MRFWFAPHSDVPLYRQLATQVQLAILSGDLRPGDRLPSTREMARRFAIHANTVSASYRELGREGWTELRPGSGVYVCDRRTQTGADAAIDAHIAEFFRRAHDVGLSSVAVRARLAEWIAAPAPDHWLLVDSDDEARRILMAELRSATMRNVCESSLAGCCDAERINGAIVCCRPTQEQRVRATVATASH